MTQYTITVSDEDNVKFISEFPDPTALFQKVVADAVQTADAKAAQALLPPVTRIPDANVDVTIQTV
jgi:hypothetical protein